MRLSLTLAAPFALLLAVGGVQAQTSYPTSIDDDGQACLEFRDSANVNSVRASQEAAARGLPLCDDVDDSPTGSISTGAAGGYVVPQSSVSQDDQHRN
jgi:hypothetical protein